MQHLDDGEIQAWLDADRSGLGRDESTAIQDHIERCSECAERARELTELTSRTGGLLSGLGAAPGLPAYRDIVVRARRLRRDGRRRSRWTASAWAASIALALGVGWWTNDLYRGAQLSPVAERADEAREIAPAEPDTPPAPAPSAAPGSAPPTAAPARESVATPPARALPEPPGPTRTTVAAAEPRPPQSTTASADVATGARARAPAQRVDSQAASDTLPVVASRGSFVRGRVVDALSGQPIQSAQVYVADLDVGVLTQQDGSYLLRLPEDEVSDGELTLKVERIGYRADDRDFTARPGETLTIDFGIDEEALQLDEIIVTGAPSGGQARALGNAVARFSLMLPSADPALEEAEGWLPRDSSEAAAALGFPIASVAGLEVTAVEVGQVAGAGAVRVRQSLGPEATLTLLQARAPLELERATTPDGRAVSLTRKAGVSIVGVAAVSLDSLNTLLTRVR